MRNILLATAALTLIAAPAMAQSISSPQVSGSVGYTVLDGDDANLGAITGRVTAKVNPYFGVEGEASFGHNTPVLSNQFLSCTGQSVVTGSAVGLIPKAWPPLA